MFDSFLKILKDKKSVLIFVVFLIIFLWFFGNILNLGLLWALTKNSGFISAFSLSLNLVDFWTTNFSLYNLILTLATIILLSLDISLIYFYYKKSVKRFSGGGFFGSFAGLLAIFGVGCASCGSVVLTGLLSFFGASALLSFLPYGGAEVAVIAFLLLVWSNLYMLKKISDPLVCQQS